MVVHASTRFGQVEQAGGLLRVDSNAVVRNRELKPALAPPESDVYLGGLSLRYLMALEIRF